MTEATAHGSPLNPALCTIYMSVMVTRSQQLDRERQEVKRHLHSGTVNRLFIPLTFIDGCNSLVRGNKKDMDRALQQAAQEVNDKVMDWKNHVPGDVNLNGENTTSIGKHRVEQPSSG